MNLESITIAVVGRAFSEVGETLLVSGPRTSGDCLHSVLKDQPTGEVQCFHSHKFHIEMNFHPLFSPFHLRNHPRQHGLRVSSVDECIAEVGETEGGVKSAWLAVFVPLNWRKSVQFAFAFFEASIAAILGTRSGGKRSSSGLVLEAVFLSFSIRFLPSATFHIHFRSSERNSAAHASCTRDFCCQSKSRTQTLGWLTRMPDEKRSIQSSFSCHTSALVWASMGGPGGAWTPTFWPGFWLYPDMYSDQYSMACAAAYGTRLVAIFIIRSHVEWL